MLNEREQGSDRQMAESQIAESQIAELQNGRVLLEESSAQLGKVPERRRALVEVHLRDALRALDRELYAPFRARPPLRSGARPRS
jgi:hypothetical protein